MLDAKKQHGMRERETVIKRKMEEKFLPLFESHRESPPSLCAPRHAVVSPFIIRDVFSP
jgi:hypothetical protein